LDNAAITTLTLKVKKSAVVDSGNPLSIVGIEDGTFGTAALQASDFQAAASQTLGSFKSGNTGESKS
jgi:hypothetical protein